MKIRLLPEAEQDLEIGANFYESQQAGLGLYFNDCLMSDIESLKLYGAFTNNTVGFTGRCPNVFYSPSTTN